MLVHGTLGDQRYWAPQMGPLGAHYHVMALSMRHCWPGRWEDGGDFTIDRHVADLAGFIRALDAGPVRLIGHSRGGHIAFRLAERHPDLLRALVLAEPGASWTKASAASLPAAAGRPAPLPRRRRWSRPATSRAGCAGWPSTPAAPAPGSAAARRASRSAATMCAPCSARSMSGGRPTPAAAEAIRTPTLLVVGEKTLPFRRQCGCAGTPHRRRRARRHPGCRASDER
ncbi:alpha/beta fold hydrolase [Siccirubricoccus deserti]